MAEFKSFIAAIEKSEALIETLPAEPEQRLAACVEALHDITEATTAMTAKKLRGRLQEKDPVTGDPRYGPKMAEKVANALKRFDALHAPLEKAQIEASSIFDKWKQQEDEKKLQEAIEALEQARERDRLEEAQRLEQQAREEEAQRQIWLQEEARKAEQDKIAVQAQALRAERANRREEESAQQKEERLVKEKEEAEMKEKMASVEVGMETFKSAFSKLKSAASAAGGAAAESAAHKALSTIVQNICQRPEDSTFRTLKLLNPQFQSHVAGHDGGLECMAAIGFQLEQRAQQEGEPELVLFLVEPDLASDMDRWSVWYDLLKECREFLNPGGV